MFTGLVQSVGRIERRAGAVVVWGCAPFAPLALGDSVAVDGVCLTAAELMADGFRADVSEETLRRTTLGRKADRGGAVNLCLLYTSPSPRDYAASRMPSSA